MGSGRAVGLLMSAGIMLAEGGSRSTNLPPLPAASYPPPSASWAASSMDPTSLPRLLTRRGGIKIRAEPVIEGESSRSRIPSGSNERDKKGGGKNSKRDTPDRRGEEEDDLVGTARLSYGSDGQKGLRMDVDLDTQADKKDGEKKGSINYKGNRSTTADWKQQQKQQDAKAAVVAKTNKKGASPLSSLWAFLKWPFPYSLFLSSSSSSTLSSSRSKDKDNSKQAAHVCNVKGGAVSMRETLDWNAFGILTTRAAGQWSSLVIAGIVLGKLLNHAAASTKFDPTLLLSLDIFTAFAAIFLSENVGFLRTKMDMSWYQRVLRKPTWTPKPIVFPLVWIPLKLLQTAALTVVWRLVERNALAVPVLLFLLHLTLGDLWNVVFFGEKRIGYGLSVMYAFYASLAASCYSFYSVRPRAAYLLVPTAVWVFVATSLNYSIWLMNGQPTRFPTKMQQ
ncbi:hypothetical protein VYU27_004883 [Nannochloropsis oceanica]